MPVFTAAAGAIIGATALTGVAATIATSVLATGLAIGTSNLLGLNDSPDFGAGATAVDEGVDVRLNPSTNNRIPVLYGNFQQRGIVNYFELSADKQSLYVVVTLGEAQTGTTIDTVFWEDLELTLDTNGVVTDATDLDGVSVDRLNGLVTVMRYPDGGRSTFLEAASSVWTSSHTMTGLAYVVIKLDYDRENGVTGLPDIRFRGVATISNPALAINDLLTSTVYGIGLDAASIDAASINTAEAYFDELVDYTDIDGVAQQQKRSTVNGVLNTGDTVLRRVETILQGCNASLRWSNGQWGIFINKADSVEAFNMNINNIIGSISVTETGLNDLYNEVEVQYGRDAQNNFQPGTVLRRSPDSVLYPSEIDRRLSLRLPLVHNSVEAAAAATIILNQGRQQLAIRHRADATAMSLEAGDVITYTDEDYGWDDKQFRITSVSEVNSGGILAYDIEAIEYADAVYEYGQLNETDVAPNVPVNNANEITPVNDLAFIGQFPRAATPYISLQWTVPSNSLVERFTIFYSTVNATFNSGNTKLGGVEQLPLGNYTSGDVVSHSLVGVPAGDVNIWVVASNDFVSSTESNLVTVTGWRPTVAQDGTFELITRYNETPSVISGANIDVGAPPANATGTGTGRNNNVNDTGWYEFDPTASDRPNAPVWTATTETQRTDEEPRVIDFAFTGTSATQTTTFTPEQQITDFALSGTVGERTFFYNARPEITDFTLSGQSADFDAAIAAQWGIKATGDTESTGPDTNDVFYIEPAGTTNTIVPETFTFTPSGDTSDGQATFSALTPGPITFTGASQGGSDLSFQIVNAAGSAFLTTLSSTDVTNFGQLRISGSTPAIRAQIAADLNAAASNTIRFVSGTTEFLIESFGTTTSTSFEVRVELAGATVTYSGTGSIMVGEDTSFTYITANATSSSVSITLDTETNAYTLADNLSGGAAIGAALNTAIGTDFTGFVKTFDAATGAITFTADDADDHTGSVVVVTGTNGTLTVAPTNTPASGTPTTIQLEVSTESIDETIELSSNITGSALRTEVFNLFSAITSITDEFTVELVTVSIDGTDTEVVRFTANDFIDHIFMITVNSGITETTSGTIVDGVPAGTATTIRITYDTSITPSFQDITFGPGNNINTAAELTTLIDGHGSLSAQHVNYLEGSTNRPTTGSLVRSQTGSSVNGVGGIDMSNGEFEFDGSNNSPTTGVSLAYNNDMSVIDDAESITFTGSENVNAVNVGDYLVVSLLRQDAGIDSTDAYSKLFIATSVTGNSIDADAVSSVDFPNYILSSESFVGDASTYVYTRALRNAGVNINNAYAAGDLVDILEPDVEGNSVLITNGADGPVDSPVVTITEQGTGDVSFEVIDERDGVASSGTATSYTINYAGSNIGGGSFTPASTSSSMASQINTAINALAQLTSTVSSSVVTATSVANSASNTLVTITTGTNKPGGVSTNNAASVRAVTQVGSAIDAYGGVDASVNVLNGGVSYYTNTFAGDAIADIVSDLVDGINVDNPAFSNFFTAAIKAGDGDELVATSDFVGTTPTLTMSVTPGFIGSVDSIGNVSQVAATLTSVRTEVSDGQSDPVVDGVLSTYSVTQGSTEVIAATNIPTGTPFTTVATLIATDISNNSATIDYTTAVDAGTLETTSTFNGTTPDLTITLVGGTNADSSLPDIQVVKTVTQAGDTGIIDLTSAIWDYALTSPTTDNDLIMIDDNGVITARRGLVLDTTELQYTSPGFDTVSVISDTTHTVGTRDASLIFTGLVSMPAISTSIVDGVNDVGYIIAYSTDYDPDDPDSATFTDLDTLSFFTSFPAEYAGQLVPVPLGVSATLDATANLTYTFRLTRIGDMTIAGFSWNMLILEELRA